MTAPVVAVLGSGDRPWREYVLAGAARRHPLWLLDRAEPSYQRGYVAGWSVLDPLDPAAVLAGLRAVAADRPLAGLVCWDERLIATAADAAATLGLAGIAPAAVRACRDKRESRERLRAVGLRQPRSVPVRSAEEAGRVAAALGWPVVVKPRNLGGSLGVVRADGPDEIAAAYATTTAARLPGVPVRADVLVEDYLDGPEVSVDGVLTRDGHRAVTLARKRLGPAPYFEETGHLVDPDDPLLTDPDVLATLAAAHAALGIDTGLTHAELRLTRDGPVVVEVNARLGGDLIPYVGGLATGVDLPAALVCAALGAEPDLTPTAHRVVGIRFLYPPADCVVRSVTLPAGLPGLLEAVQVAPAGATVRVPPEGHTQRYGYLLATGADRDECDRRLDAAEAASSLEWDPLPERVSS